MKAIDYERMPARRITPENENFFFGYYDMQPWSGSGRYHLCHKVGFWQRMPTMDDRAEIGMIDMQTGAYTPLDGTTAWNFQQGAMLTWNPSAPDDEIIFNVRTERGYQCKILNIHTGASRLLDYPLANVAPNGKYGVSINFARMYDFRPGYGYHGIDDPFGAVSHPADDGVYLVDLDTGRGKLVLSLDTLWQLARTEGMAEGKVLVNHINFNTDGSRFVMLFRIVYPPKDAREHSLWKTATISANADGSEPFLWHGFSDASHYNWRDPLHLVIYATPGAEPADGTAGWELGVWTDRTHLYELVDTGFFKRDGHCNYSPDGRFLLYDSYADGQGYRDLYVYDLERKEGMTLGRYYSYPELPVDIRTDFHPRWSRDGKSISFDSNHEGFRGIYTMDLSTIVK